MKRTALRVMGAVIFLAACAYGALADGTALAKVFDQERSPANDLIVLWDGKVYQGQILNETLHVMTPYAALTIPTRRCAGVSFEDAAFNTEVLVTVNRNRMSGIVVDRVIRFKPAGVGQEARIPKALIRFILTKTSDEESAFLEERAETDVFVMTNGDVLTGKPIENGLVVKGPGGIMDIPFAQIAEVAFEDHGNAVVVKRQKGADVRGALESKPISVALDIGMRLSDLYPSAFVRITVAQDEAQVAARVQEETKKPAPRPREEAAPAPPTREPAGDAPRLTPVTDKIFENSIGMRLRRVEPGSFMMGSNRGFEGPAHKVTLTKPFYIGVCEVTQAQWEAVTGDNPSEFKDPSRPVERVSWSDARDFCRKLSGMERVRYRLPTEAEWEYACRAGSETPFFWGAAWNGEYAWCKDNSTVQPPEAPKKFTNMWGLFQKPKNTLEYTQPVGEKKPNAWGLHDTSGNVWEWCEDRFTEYRNAPCTNPVTLKGSDRVSRGGCYSSAPGNCRSAFRLILKPDSRTSRQGLRVVREE